MAEGPPLRDLVEWIAREIVDDPDQVQVREVGDGRTVALEVRVAPSDMGKVIGRSGRMARAIRTVVKAAAVRSGVRAMVEFLD